NRRSGIGDVLSQGLCQESLVSWREFLDGVGDIFVETCKYFRCAQDKGGAAGEAGAEVLNDLPGDNDGAAGHVLTTVVANAFDHRGGAGVAHAETLAHSTPDVELTGGGTVSGGLTGDASRVVLSRTWARFSRADNDPPAGTALAHKVIGVAF